MARGAVADAVCESEDSRRGGIEDDRVGLLARCHIGNGFSEVFRSKIVTVEALTVLTKPKPRAAAIRNSVHTRCLGMLPKMDPESTSSQSTASRERTYNRRAP